MTRLPPMRSKSKSTKSSGIRRGLTLLEVTLALAILVVTLAVIGQLVDLGLTNAREARDLTIAQILAENKLNELTAGLIPLSGAAGVPLEENNEWTYSIELNPTDQLGMYAVRVTVSEVVGSAGRRPTEFSIVRWMRDPNQIPVDTTTSTSSSSTGTSP